MMAPMPTLRLKNAWPIAASIASPVSFEKSAPSRNSTPALKSPSITA